MEPVMKIVDSKEVTHYIFHPERVLQIFDVGKPDKPAASMFFHNGSENENITYLHIAGTTARGLKRSIQENVPEKIGFLKLDYNTDTHGPSARRYLNVDSIVSLHAFTRSRKIDGQTVEVEETELTGHGYETSIEGTAQSVAAQIRRVLKRLDQDEEFCCEAPAAEEASEE